MWVDLGLKLLEFRPLGQKALVVYLLDQLLQMVHHSVEGLVEIGELIVSLLMDAHVEIIAFHTSEGVHQRPDGFVHQMTHRECKQAHGEHGNHPEQHQEKEIGMAEAKQMFRGRKGDQNQIALL